MPHRLRSTDLVYFPVPKIACTSIKFALLGHNAPELADKLPSPVPVQLGRRRGRNVHHLYPSTTWRAVYPLIYPGRWFAVVRDPLKRFLSCYANRILHHDDLKHSDPAVLSAKDLPCQPDLATFVDRLEEYMQVSRSLHHHIRPICDYLGTRADRFDRVFSMRELSEIPAYCAAAGAPVTLPHKQTGGPKLALSELTPTMEEKLRRYYAEDYRVWGLHMDG